MKLLNRFLFLILVVLTGLPLFGQNLDGYEDYINQAMKDWKVQGTAVVIVKNGKIFFIKGFGYRDVKNGLPVTPNTLFAIGSCTKAFTAAAVNLLVEDGKLDLDKPIINYFPDFKMYDAYVSQNITSRDLLSHRSGLPRHDLAWYGADNISRKDLITKMQYLEPSAGFREKWQYQNGMFAVAGYVVELVSGKTWEDFTKARILVPLEMTNTNFSIYEMQKSSDYSKPYAEKNDEVNEVPYANIYAAGPAGSINSSVSEMANWIIMQLDGGKFKDRKVISESSINQMQFPQMVMPQGVTDELFYGSYGMGWMITSYRGHLRVEHGGNIDGFSASVCLMPKDSFGVAVLTNMNGTNLTSVIRNYTVDKMLGLSEIDWNNKIMESRKKAKDAAKENKNKPDPNKIEGTVPSHKLEDYVGKYSHPAYGEIIITKNGNQLGAEFHGLKAEMSHYHYDYFTAYFAQYDEKLKLNFHTCDKGNVYMITVPLQDGVKDIEFKRVQETKELNKSDIEKYTGEYELGEMILKVSTRGENVLMLSIKGQPDYELIPIGNESFNIKGLDGYSIKFTVTDNTVTEMNLNQPNGVFTAKKK